MFKRLISLLVCLSFVFGNIQESPAQDFSIDQLPVPGVMVGESVPFSPLALKGLVINPKKPLEFQFIVDTGRGAQDTASVKDQANQLVKYFLAGLTIPEGDLWVNLSPYEKNRMVPEALGQTDLGRDLLAQDYILKQLTASLIYPEKGLGKEFWSRVYAKAQQQFGTTNVPVNTFNKVWILPNQAQVFENGNAAYVTRSTLKVMLDEDYLALQKHSGASPLAPRNDTHSIGANIIRSIILPEIEKEVNTGKNFAPLRQIYQALILAKWYKEAIQNGLLDAVYTNKNKIAGVNLNDQAIKEQIYERYLKAYKKGAFNYIKDELAPDGQIVPRKYFSGGIKRLEPAHVDTDGAMLAIQHVGAVLALKVILEKPKSEAMVAKQVNIIYGRHGDIKDFENLRQKLQSVIDQLRDQGKRVVFIQEGGGPSLQMYLQYLTHGQPNPAHRRPEFWLEKIIPILERNKPEQIKQIENDFNALMVPILDSQRQLRQGVRSTVITAQYDFFRHLQDFLISQSVEIHSENINFDAWRRVLLYQSYLMMATIYFERGEFSSSLELVKKIVPVALDAQRKRERTLIEQIDSLKADPHLGIISVRGLNHINMADMFAESFSDDFVSDTYGTTDQESLFMPLELEIRKGLLGQQTPVSLENLYGAILAEKLRLWLTNPLAGADQRIFTWVKTAVQGISLEDFRALSRQLSFKSEFDRREICLEFLRQRGRLEGFPGSSAMLSDQELFEDWQQKRVDNTLVKTDPDQIKTRPLNDFEIVYNSQSPIPSAEVAPPKKAPVKERQANDFILTALAAKNLKAHVDQFTLNEVPTLVIPSVDPRAVGHLLLLPDFDKNLIQKIEPQHIAALLLRARAGDPDALAFFHNSFGAGAVLNNLHVHVYFKKKQAAVAKRQLAIEKAKKIEVAKKNDVQVLVSQDYPAAVALFQGKDAQAVGDESGKFVTYLQEQNIPYNVMITAQGVYVIPRSVEAVKMAENTYINLGGMEMAGRFEAPNEAIYEGMTDEQIIAYIHEAGVSADTLNQLIARYDQSSAMLAAEFRSAVENAPGQHFADVIRQWADNGKLWQLVPELEPVLRNKGGSGPGSHATAWSHILMVCEMMQALLLGDQEAFNNGGLEKRQGYSIWKEISPENFNWLHEKAKQVVSRYGLYEYALISLDHDAGKAIDAGARHVPLGVHSVDKFIDRIWTNVGADQRALHLLHVAAHSDIARALIFGDIGEQTLEGIDLDFILVLSAADGRSARSQGWLSDLLVEEWKEFVDRNGYERMKERGWENSRLEAWSRDPFGEQIPGREDRLKQLFEIQFEKTPQLREFLRKAAVVGYATFHKLKPENLLKLMLLFQHLQEKLGLEKLAIGLHDVQAARPTENFIEPLTIEQIQNAQIRRLENRGANRVVEILGVDFIIYPEGDMEMDNTLPNTAMSGQVTKGDVESLINRMAWDNRYQDNNRNQMKVIYTGDEDSIKGASSILLDEMVRDLGITRTEFKPTKSKDKMRLYRYGILESSLEGKEGDVKAWLIKRLENAPDAAMLGFASSKDSSGSFLGFVTSLVILLVKVLRDKKLDRASIAKNGGIDLNQIKVNSTGKRVNVHFDQAQLNQLEQGGFEGFTPVITGFAYIKSPFPLLGIK